jgi:nicotinamidase-related amidase
VLTAIATDRVATDAELPKPDPRFKLTPIPPKNFYKFVVLCYDRQSGKELWEKVAAEKVPHEGTHESHSYCAGSPTTDGKFLYASFGSFGTYCYDFDGNLKWSRRLSRSVVVVVDAQRDYVDGKLPLPGIAVATAELHRLLERARQLGTPIVHVQQLSPAGRGAFEEGTPGAAFADAAMPGPGETVVTKKLPNSFANTGLADALRSLGRSELIIVGYMTHMCVSTTARAALDNGYAVTVVADACATRDLRAPDGSLVDEVKR